MLGVVSADWKPKLNFFFLGNTAVCHLRASLCSIIFFTIFQGLFVSTEFPCALKVNHVESEELKTTKFPSSLALKEAFPNRISYFPISLSAR